MIKVYLRDWYYNAGIVGFLKVLSGGERNINNIIQNLGENIVINKNYLEFDLSLLENYYENYKKMAFEMFFDLERYKERIDNLINKVKEINDNQRVPNRILQDTALSGKIVNNFIKTINNDKSFENIFQENNSCDNILARINSIKDFISNEFNNVSECYIKIKDKTFDNNNTRTNFVDYFLENEVSKRVCNYKKIQEYITKLNTLISNNQNNNNNQKCFICAEFKKEYDFSNAITQIIGFNSDNSNWIWGFNASKAKTCALCALIYSAALHGMVFINRKIENEYKTFFYFLNRNSDISTLYNSFWIFKERMTNRETQNKPFYTILQEVAIELINQQAEAMIENINFLEVAENQFGGQSTKSYNVYNYNISKELAEFIRTEFNNIPKGYYKERNFYSDITEELLKKTLEQSLNFSDLSRYFEYIIRSFDQRSNIIARYSISRITRYILSYINKIKGGDRMALDQIVNKAFSNGCALGQKIAQENKIKGIAYQLLNDLKIGDRNAFTDKYLRLCMSYGEKIKLGSNNELTDMDNFISFGYAFVNGLLSNINQQNNEEVQNG
ncbi:MAG: type I-B CRISPR-associated protein Cas8b1/Cst1 [Exilispira sp.]